MSRRPSYLDFDSSSYAWKPDIDYRAHLELYRVGRGEQGVLICQPYKDELVPLWRFKTPEEAEKSSAAIEAKFKDYLDAGDFVGAALARKFLQMGYTRARRYANYRGAGNMPATTITNSHAARATRRRRGPPKSSTRGGGRPRQMRTTLRGRRIGRRGLVEGSPAGRYLSAMPRSPKPKPPTRLIQEWPLSPAATMGSAVRVKGILLEVRAHVPFAERKFLHVEAGALVLRVPEDDCDDHQATTEAITRKLVGIEDLPVIPREVEDILSIKQAERHRWLKDGRLQSAGTRTVKLRGRARKITFHVFDPHHIEDVLDRDLPDVWREEDKLAAAENRRRGAHKAALRKAGNLAGAGATRRGAAKDDGAPVKGWDDFDLDGLLR